MTVFLERFRMLLPDLSRADTVPDHIQDLFVVPEHLIRESAGQLDAEKIKNL